MRNLSKMGRATAPVTRHVMLDSMKTAALTETASNPALRRPRSRRVPWAKLTKPSTPPLRWMRAINEPTMALNRITQVFPRSLNTSTNASSEATVPAAAPQSCTTTYPTHIPAKSETNTWRVAMASTMARAGGSSDQMP